MIIYSVEEAKKSILIRKDLLNVVLDEKAKERIFNIFGEKLEAREVVIRILNDIKDYGDKSVKKWSSKLDGQDKNKSLLITDTDFDRAFNNTSEKVIKSLLIIKNRVLEFHQSQPKNSWFTKKLGGQIGQIVSPIEKIGIYIPGGTAPLPSTVLMTAIPAIVAGVKVINIVSPPVKNQGIPDIILTTVRIIRKINNEIIINLYQVGGVQAIGALTYGTESISKVNKIVGPGNIFVSLAKREVYGIVGIDGIYGPTEALIIADENANPSFIASDLLAQAEHDYLSIPILLTPSETLANKIKSEIKTQLGKIPRKDIALHSISHQGGIVVTDSIEESIQLSNEFAPEHLSLMVDNPEKYLDLVQNAGGIFLGEYSCEVLGDYIAGPSHVMPTNGSAKFSSPLSVSDFVKITSLVSVDKKTSIKILLNAEIIAKEENLQGHAESARRRSI